MGQWIADRSCAEHLGLLSILLPFCHRLSGIMTLSALRRIQPNFPRWRNWGQWLGLFAGAIGPIVVLALSLNHCDWESLLAFDWHLLSGWLVLESLPDRLEYQRLLAAIVGSLLVVVVMIPRLKRLPGRRSRAAIVAILAALTLRYLAWRVTATLNVSTIADGTVGIVLLLCELLLWGNSLLELALMLRLRDRRAETDRAAARVAAGYHPSVDIWIPTYGEPVAVLRRTVIGCQALDYAGPVKVYLLDDGRRSEVRDLAAELGCGYLTRPDNRHAKAGNLNHAIGKTHGQLIVCFDADFVPTRNFLQRTVGFFTDWRVGLVQTHQHFLNPDPIVYNLGLADRLTTNRVAFSHYIEPMRDGAAAAICYGSSFVVRRSALEQVGGFVTRTLCEDYFTGLALTAAGYEVLYVNEPLSAGLSPESMSAYIAQQQRWAAGTMQGFFIRENPMTLRGLTLLQRLHCTQGWIHWVSTLPRLLFLVMPVPIALLGLMPFKTGWLEWALWFLPLYGAYLATSHWLNRRSCSALVGDLYAIVGCVPIGLTVLQTLWRPFGRAFRVTPKGIARDRAVFNPMPGGWLLGILALSLGAWGWSLAGVAGWLPVEPDRVIGARLNLVWLSYNLLVVGSALRACVDAPKPHRHEWFQRQRAGRCLWGDRPVVARVRSQLVSETGAMVVLAAEAALPQPGDQGWLELRDHPIPGQAPADLLRLPMQIVHVGDRDRQTGEQMVEVAWEPLTLAQQRSLVQWLYCQPGQWQIREAPGEFASLWLLLRCWLRPRRWQTDRRVAEAIALP